MSDSSLRDAAGAYTVSRFGYYLDFVISPVCMAVLLGTELALHGARGLLRFAIAAAIGYVTWTLVEYVLHRFVFHMVPGIREAHGEHHRRPAAFIGVGSVYTFTIFMVLTTLACLVAGYSETVTEGLVRGFYSGFTDGAGGMFGFLAGYVFYIVAHDAMHHRAIAPGHFLYAAKMRHVAHHKGLEANFGITVAWWDKAFRTYRTISHA